MQVHALLDRIYSYHSVSHALLGLISSEMLELALLAQLQAQ